MLGWTPIGSADDRTLRNLFGTFLTGITIVTLRDEDGVPRGFTANSFTSVSLDPPLVLVCVANGASSYGALCRAERFAINILGDGQKSASAAFASRAGRKFDEVATWSTGSGPPLVVDSLSSIECAREQVIQAGDHAIVIGRVLGFRMGAGQPLGYYRGGYVTFALGAEALEHLGGVALRIGCLIERGEQVLLVKRRSAGGWELPTLPLRAGEDHRQVVPRLLAFLGIRADVGFLYSVFQEPGDPHTTLIFRGVADEAARLPESPIEDLRTGLFSREDAPWDEIAGQSQRAVLQRFFEERAQAKFGIYWETEDGGRVASLEGMPRRWQFSSASPPAHRNDGPEEG